MFEVMVEEFSQNHPVVPGSGGHAVSVVLVTFNSSKVVERAIRSVPSGVGVIVVDNASSDDSAALARKAGAQCICGDRNLGFTRASNLGASKCNGEFILFMNPDAALRAGALETMVATAQRFPDAGAVAPRLFNDSGRLPWRYSSVLHPYDRSAPPEPEAASCVPLLTGAALLCRACAFNSIGGFDENIFLYHDDDDLSLRLTRAGWSLIYEPEAEVFHVSGGSSPQSLRLLRFKARERLVSRKYVLKKYGLGFDPDREFRKAVKRLLIAILKLDLKRVAAAMGRLDALKNL